MSARGIFVLGAALAASCLRAVPPAEAAESVAATNATPAATPASAQAQTAPGPSKPVGVYVIPVREEIDEPVFFVIRRGLKEATDHGIKNVVFDMKTPGGSLATTLEILDAINHFDGKTYTYVDTEAMSAGAFIAAMTDEIWFAPRAVIGASAPVMSTGGDIDATMKQKIVSYLRAKMRAITEGKGAYRGEVIEAMIDSNYELKIGDVVLKPKGELLSLTNTEAAREFGDPPQPLLSAGTADSVDALLARKFGEGNFRVTHLEVTWSERLAQYLTNFSPLLLGLGLLALFIEFKTPGFGFFGISGIVLLALVFFGSWVAGLAGHEPALFFALGLLLLVLEIFFFPGAVLPATLGLVMIFGSLVWTLSDLWPGQPVEFSTDVFLGPIGDVMLGILIAIVGAFLLARVLPGRFFWDKLVLNASLSGHSRGGASDGAALPGVDPMIGKRGRAVTDLFPSGEVEVDGRRFAARLDLGTVERGEEVVVTRRGSFGLYVEKPPK